jgi:hypothetical protein
LLLLKADVTSQLQAWTVIGFTGHRSLTDPRLVAETIRRAIDELRERRCPLAAVCSTASGADTLFLEEVARRRLPYFLIFPFAPERFRQDFKPDEWDRVAKHFAGALDIEEVHDVDTDNEAYLECGIRTVDRCDVLIAVWNGKPAAGEGGTGDIVDYARDLKKPIIWIDSSTGAIKKECFELLEPCSMGTGASDGRAETEVPSGRVRQVFRQYLAFNKTAKAHAPRTRLLIQEIIQLHLFATAIAITGCVLVSYLSGLVEHLLGVCEVVVLGIAYVLSRRHRLSHHEWLHARASAEICRSFLSCWRMRRRGEQLPVPPIQQQDVLVQSLRMAWYLDRGAERSLEKAREKYISHRVARQIRYFSDKYYTAGERGKWLKKAATTVTLLSIACGLFVLVISMNEYRGLGFGIAKLCSMLLPLIPPVLLSLMVALDLSRRSRRFDNITNQLKQAEQRLRAARTWPGLWREVNGCENLLLQELAEWYALTQFAGESH